MSHGEVAQESTRIVTTAVVLGSVAGALAAASVLLPRAKALVRSDS